MVAEIKQRLTEELDYRREAANQARFADFFRGHPFIHVPDVVPSHSGATRADERPRRRRLVARGC